jgi:uncharacterized caspase-like protein
MKRNYLLLFVLLIMHGVAYAQNRGLLVENVVGPEVQIGKQWAVFIAIDKYQDRGGAKLDHPVKDARELHKIISGNFIVDNLRELYDDKASAEGIRMLFEELQKEVGKDDSVFVFHAGHGYRDDRTDKGAWIPSDAGSNRFRKDGWIGHDEIRSYLDKLPAKHVFLISDSCFSGDLLQTSRGQTLEFNND